MAKEAAVSGGIKGILKRRETDMTSGNIWKHLISFALPLMVGSIFQQLYNTVDTWVVGNYVSNEAFSAVGSVGPIINMLIGFFTGLATGAGVVISQYFGAKRPEEVSATVHTSMAMTFLMGIAFTIIGIVTTPLSLRLMNTPAEVMPEARTYLVIYFAGVLGLMVYNMGAGILRAVGDSNRPFYFLIITAVLNTILDLVFVIVFHMGVAGVAWATIIAQAVSAVLIMIVLVRSRTAVRFSFLKMKIDWKIMGKIVKVGMPAAIQMAITSFSNIFVQGYINHFGADVMSGWTAYAKIDMLAMLPMQSIGLANTTFVGQNLGADLIKRTKQGVNISLILAEGITIVLSGRILQCQTGGDPLRHPDHPLAVALLCTSRFQSDLCRSTSWIGKQPGPHDHYAFLLRPLPPDLPVYLQPLYFQYDHSHSHGISGRLGRLQSADLYLL